MIFILLRYIFDSLYNAGVKRSLSVYTLKKICVVGFLHQVLADILCVKTTLGPFIEVFILRFCDLVMLNL